ncbi:hypothetical protein [Serratia fonticola]
MKIDSDGQRAQQIAAEIGEAVVGLILSGKLICRDNILSYLGNKKKEVGNSLHKGVLRDAIGMIKKGE